MGQVNLLQTIYPPILMASITEGAPVAKRAVRSPRLHIRSIEPGTWSRWRARFACRIMRLDYGQGGRASKQRRSAFLFSL
jgi:hypothetical protein